ncbi:hypothetical protein ACTU6U_12080 [Microbacterium sp. A196]|uniref:hypothetical protein n=1 Tax=Microbacterium sp. A196 TaxID=3457320 RepID=UPI003FD1AD3B
MSTRDQQGDQPLTRKQLREIRLTGATPVIGEEEAAAAAKKARPTPAVPVPKPAAPVEVPPAPVDAAQVDTHSTPLTRRQARAQERIRTASVPVIQPEEQNETPEVQEPDESENENELVSEIPSFAPVSAKPVDASADESASADDVEEESDAAADEETAFEADVDAESDDFSTVFGVSEEEAEEEDAEQDDIGEGDELPVADAVITGERPVVSPTFGKELFEEKAGKGDVPSFSPSFDELITSDSGGSNRAPNTLIFTHPGASSLSGPVASTGELLITGSYELPQGLGSHGHAHGAADGKEIDATLIDKELPPASSPTPIAASSAISTLKPAGEVIRPPAPEKGNKLMLTLAITAGGLALALAVALVVAFTTNVFG